MSSPFASLLPTAPRWVLRWSEIVAAVPALARLESCPQDPSHHAEGDALTHTGMVCEALTGLVGWRSLPAAEREEVFLAALFHDLAKPESTRVDVDGRLRSPGHSRRGAIAARRLLWELGHDPESRERVAALVRSHMWPFHAAEDQDLQRTVLRVSQAARCDHLVLLAEADARGRVAPDQDRMLESVAMFAEYCREQDCFAHPRRFPSDHSRFLYFRKEGRDPDYLAHDDTRSRAVVMSGLPGAGKDNWLSRHGGQGEVISLDGVRAELRTPAGDDQGRVAAVALQRARALLREGQPLTWNATNLSRELRGKVIGLMAAYRARVRIVYVEAPAALLRVRNEERDRPVPAAVMERLLGRWEVPDLTEAHELTWVT